MRKMLKNQRGSVIVLWAFLLPILLGIAGLVIDIGYAYIHRTNLQHVADAAALAGAADIKNQMTAEKLAREYIAKNMTTLPHTIDIIFTTNNNRKRINVDLTDLSPTFFMKIFGWNGVDVHVHAAAIGRDIPNPFNYALVSAGDQPFSLFDQGAPADNAYWGDIYVNGPLTVNGGSGGGSNAPHTDGQITGVINTTTPDYPSDINNASNGVFQDNITTSADKIKVDYSGDNMNPYIRDRIDAEISNSTTYDANHPCNIWGGIDYSKLGGPLYVDGAFKKNTHNGADPNHPDAPSNSFTRAKEIVIIAKNDIVIKDAIVNDPNAKIFLCSLEGSITFGGSIENFPNVTFLAPRGTIDLNCSITHITGSLIGDNVKVGNAGNLQIKNNGGSTGGNATSGIRLVE